MEKGGADASNRLSTWDKKISSSSSSSNSDAAPSMKTHTTTQTQPFLSKAFMFHNEGINLDRPLDVGGANEALGNINRDDNVSSSGNFANSHCRSSSSSTNLQAFNMFPPASLYSTAPYKSPGGNGMAATVGFPFTSAQWGELERQAMIYKYMMCSMPVPPELLFPLTRNFPDSSASPLYNVRCARNGDPEPGRCKRTDGKKWRCSRDVAPHQKYCERHLHRGRPRSRKPVEVKNSSTNGGESSHKKTRLEQAPRPASLPTPTPTPAPVSSQQVVSATANDSALLLFNSKTDITISTRDLGLMMEAGMVNVNTDEQRWQLLMGSNVGFSAEGSSSIHGSTTLFDQDYVDQHHHNHHHALNVFAASGIEAPAGFIDAWSVDNNLNSTNNGNTESTNQGSLSPSLNLSMAMAVGNPLDQGVGKVQLESHEDNSYKNWLGRPVSWQPFAQGGPLAEALHLGSVYAYPASPHDSIGTPATTVSSPSGVLQRTFFSHSDSSVCNSPTFAAHASEVAFPRFNHND